MAANRPDIASELKANPVQTVLTHSAPLWNLPAHRARCLEAMLYLEMASINYQRQICKYNINYFVAELELPMLRHKLETTRSIIDFCEGIGNEKTHIVGKNNQLNSHLEFPQKADVTALQSLIRDRLHLVFLHQLYANEDNWKEYYKQMGHYLPFILRRFLLIRERQYILQILTRSQITTTKHAKQILCDTLHVIFTKMNVNHIVEVNKNGDNKIQYFFGTIPTSLDAVLCSELVLLECSQLPHKYLNDIKDDPKIQYLLKYAKRIMEHYHSSILSKLSSQNEIEPIQILSKPIQFAKKENKVKKERFYNTFLNTDDKKNSALFVLGSATAFVLYWKMFQH